jgi:hypothetical protein
VQKPIAIAAIATLVSTSVFAADIPVKALPPAGWDWSGFFIGVGGSFNSSHFDQSLQGVSGTISFFDGPDLIATGQESGPFFDFSRNKTGFAPDVQLGYVFPFAGGDWLAGLKFTYKYANIDSKENVSIPQMGSGITLVPTPTPLTLTGFLQISPAEINLKHQLALIGTLGRMFGNVALYAGGGPALFDYARSVNFTIINPVFVHIQNGSLMDFGPAVLNTQERITNQSVTLTLNYQFH